MQVESRIKRSDVDLIAQNPVERPTMKDSIATVEDTRISHTRRL